MVIIVPPAIRITCQHDNSRRKPSWPCPDLRDRRSSGVPGRCPGPGLLRSHRVLNGPVHVCTWLRAPAAAVPAPACYLTTARAGQ